MWAMEDGGVFRLQSLPSFFIPFFDSVQEQRGFRAWVQVQGFSLQLGDA